MSIFFLKEKKYLTKSSKQTKSLGQRLAKGFLKNYSRNKALVIGLEGDLGGGKTTFIQGLAKGLGIKERVLSPTFVVMKKFKVQNSKFKVFFHIDCYRIQSPKELLALGFKEIIANSQNIVAIEWADKIKEILPQETLWLKFDFKGKNQRKIVAKQILCAAT